jgi:hypothetical protein
VKKTRPLSDDGSLKGVIKKTKPSVVVVDVDVVNDDLGLLRKRPKARKTRPSVDLTASDDDDEGGADVVRTGLEKSLTQRRRVANASGGRGRRKPRQGAVAGTRTCAAAVASQMQDYAGEVVRERRGELGPNYGVMGLAVCAILALYHFLGVEYLVDLLASKDCVSRTGNAALTSNGRVYTTQFFYDYLFRVVSVNLNPTHRLFCHEVFVAHVNWRMALSRLD